jgi:hypothetical protein
MLIYVYLTWREILFLMLLYELKTGTQKLKTHHPVSPSILAAKPLELARLPINLPTSLHPDKVINSINKRRILMFEIDIFINFFILPLF